MSRLRARASQIRSWIDAKRGLDSDDASKDSSSLTPGEAPKITQKNVKNPRQQDGQMLRYLKRHSLVLGTSTEETKRKDVGVPTVTVRLDPGKDGHVYHPGSRIFGHVAVKGCDTDAKSIKSVKLEVIGEMRL